MPKILLRTEVPESTSPGRRLLRHRIRPAPNISMRLLAGLSSVNGFIICAYVVGTSSTITLATLVLSGSIRWRVPQSVNPGFCERAECVDRCLGCVNKLKIPTTYSHSILLIVKTVDFAGSGGILRLKTTPGSHEKGGEPIAGIVQLLPLYL